MPLLVPTATYESPSESQTVNFVPGDGPHSTDGKTTQISDIDQLNAFLTAKMKMSNKRKLDDAEADVEKRLLDDGVDEDSD
ncbi:hypothetical protein OXX80_003366 [Metschnikowia pulcherrima]